MENNKLKLRKPSKRKLDSLKRACSGNMAYIAERCGCNQSTVYRVLNGQTNNHKVIDEAIEVRRLLDIKLKEKV